MQGLQPPASAVLMSWIEVPVAVGDLPHGGGGGRERICHQLPLTLWQKTREFGFPVPCPAPAAHRQGSTCQATSHPNSLPVNPCCYFPCQHQGVCVRVGLGGYECDCTRTGYFGINCSSPELWTRLYNVLKPSPAFYHFILTHFRWVWDVINSTFIRDTLMRLVLTVRANLIPSPPTFNSDYGYISWEAYANVSYYTRVLPPVPDSCPTPMGTKGKQQLPDPQLLAERFLLRQKFEADPRGTNLMFAFFAQHFTHQFFKTSGKMGRGFTKALGHGVDLGHLYGDNLQRQHQLRLFRDGKLKFQVVDGEVYPPTVTDAPVHMVYPSAIPKEKQLAMGQEVFGLLPGLCMYATLWLREHNRVCDILKQEHPTWSDEQLFQTARLILIGETIKIVIEDYVQHLSGYYLSLKFDPELLFGTQFQYRNRIAVEFNQLYHWHGLMPDSFIIQGEEYSYDQFLYNTSMLMDYGVEALVESFSKQAAGRIGGGQTINANVLKVAIGVIKESRQLRLRPFNEYRKRFGMKPYRSFQELTGGGGDTGTCPPCAQQKQDRRWSHPGHPPQQPSRRGWYQLCEKLKCLRSVAAAAVLSRPNSLASEYIATSQLWGSLGNVHLPRMLWISLCFVTFCPPLPSSTRPPAAPLRGFPPQNRGAESPGSPHHPSSSAAPGPRHAPPAAHDGLLGARCYLCANTVMKAPLFYDRYTPLQ
uniref:Prostaglandin G/H synthase 1 n=1 Tax=Falco tinnunculus TaxID=100819 RepID=A0A8C4UR39_FALTI